jgi:hypothetical protein
VAQLVCRIERVETHEFRHALFGLFLLGNLDPKVAEVFGEMRIDAGIVACIAVHVYRVRSSVSHRAIGRYAKALEDEGSPSGLTGRTVGLDSSELDSDGVSRIRCMLQRVSVPASSAVLLPTAPKRTTDEAKPQIGGEAATFVSARSETCELEGQHQLMIAYACDGEGAKGRSPDGSSFFGSGWTSSRV